MAKPTTEQKTKFQETLDKLDKAYGKGSVVALDSKINGEYDVISTGSLGFDYTTLGVGGFVKGKVYELMGWEGTGKSTICGHAAANCQKTGGLVLYIDGEHSLDRNYFQALGVDTTKMLIAQPSNGEEGFNIAMEMMKTGDIDLLIIDSDNALQPKAVVDGEVGESAIGKKARLNNSVYPKMKSAADMYHTCVIIVSQYREKIGVMFGSPVTTQGGHALKFYSDGRIEVSKSVAKDDGEAYGNKTKVRATKNKMASPYKTTEFDIIFGEGIDTFGEVIALATDLEIIKKSGSWYSYGETKIGQGEDSVKLLLKDNPELFEEIRNKVIKHLTKQE